MHCRPEPILCWHNIENNRLQSWQDYNAGIIECLQAIADEYESTDI